MNQIHPTAEAIVDYLHGELPPEEDAAIHAHLAACAQCTESREAELSLTELLRAHADAEERELPPSVVAGIWKAVSERPPSVWERLSVAFRPAITVPVAIAVAAFIYFGVRVAHGPAQAATIDASYYVNSHATLAASTPLSEEDPVPEMPMNDGDAR